MGVYVQKARPNVRRIDDGAWTDTDTRAHLRGECDAMTAAIDRADFYVACGLWFLFGTGVGMLLSVKWNWVGLLVGF